MNILLLVLLAIMVTFSILVAVYVYYNRESTNSIDLLIKVLIAFIAALIIISFDILKEEKSDNKKVKVLILRNNETIETKDFSNRLLKINSFTNGYSLLDEVNLLSRKNDSIKNSETIALDLLENTLWVWLSKKYHLHWEMEQTNFSGISGGSGNMGILKEAENEVTKYKIDSLREILKNNYYELSPARFWGVSLPKNTKVSFLKRTSRERTFLLRNKYIQFKISVYKIGNSGVEFTNLGERILKSLSKYYPNTESFYANNLIVEFTCDYSRWFKGSPDTIRQKKWVSEIINEFSNDFDWEILKPYIEKVYGL
jgi:hypothetical protein